MLALVYRNGVCREGDGGPACLPSVELVKGGVAHHTVLGGQHQSQKGCIPVLRKEDLELSC